MFVFAPAHPATAAACTTILGHSYALYVLLADLSEASCEIGAA